MSIPLVLSILPPVLLIAGLPIYLVLLVSAGAAILGFMSVPPTLIPQIMFGGLDKFALLSVPFFIFAGEIMARGGVSRRIVACILSLCGRFKAARPITTIAASEFFGAVSGSSPATVAAMGKLMYPSLREGGYGEKFSLGLLTSAGGIASVMPPSILMILYAASAEQSVTELFAAGVIPALLLGFATLVYILWHARKVKPVPEARRSAVETVALVLGALPALGTPLVILGGIYSGVFSPTESAGIAGVYGILVARFLYREISWCEIWEVVVSSARLTAQILLVVAASGVFSWVLTTSGIPQALVQSVGGLADSPWVVLIAINLFLLVVGCLIDPVSAIVLLTPMLVPLASHLGIDLVHFGVIMAVNLSIGMFTPPFGLNIFTSHALFNVKISTICAGLVPFIVLQVITLFVISFIPWLSLVGAQFVR
ncbi:TRAP transporter large permease subunit [Azoarcus indigens]|uniref:TRAP transporter large permease protein n=1 Tax=Azoarcus indigens TaxID=29545 RepID=A0A4R6DT49_9RHOO|nr:TRAP transporter large permease [Azoarcus indigens]NMG67029.1 TRAP transporter large permease subunit [Azoarcus indigens]TDN48183.1 C4-dicarboxylate transporter DctM subunit [Azoarcus indigens]